MSNVQQKILESYFLLHAAGYRSELNERGEVVMTILSVDECFDALGKIERGETIPDNITVIKETYTAKPN